MQAEAPREVSIRAARRSLADLVNRAVYQGERTVLSRNGRRVAALVTIHDLETVLELEISARCSEDLSNLPVGKQIARRLAAELGIPLGTPDDVS